MEANADCPCENCARLKREYELSERLLAAREAEAQALQELIRLKHARLADLERRHRALTRGQR